ncbi:MAG: hypothetical protein GF398_07555 [Chitinivibrionales bacterium]|nr:hypothetical protein [Chitinivibrionales bacterium]
MVSVKTSLLFLLLLFADCTVPPSPLSGTDAIALAPRISLLPARSFKSSAALAIKIEGEKIRAACDIVYITDSVLNCTVYNPFGGIVAEIAMQENLVRMYVGDTMIVRSSRDRIRIPGILLNFPFTFSEFKRIITGTLVQHLPGQEFQSQNRQNKITVFVFKGMNYSTSVTYRRNRLAGMTFKSQSGGAPWSVTYARFEDKVAHAIEMNHDSGDYFNVFFNKFIAVN